MKNVLERFEICSLPAKVKHTGISDNSFVADIKNKREQQHYTIGSFTSKNACISIIQALSKGKKGLF